jgi:hypothetical protein
MARSKQQQGEGEHGDYLGSFLRAVKRSPTGSDAPGNGPGLLEVIADHDGPMSFDELRAASRMSFDTFSERFQSLRKANLLALEGDPGNEEVVLTDAGKAYVGRA